MDDLAKRMGFAGQSSIQRYLDPDYDTELRPGLARRFAEALGDIEAKDGMAARQREINELMMSKSQPEPIFQQPLCIQGVHAVADVNGKLWMVDPHRALMREIKVFNIEYNFQGVSLGGRIKRLREGAGYTQAELAEAAGVTPQAVSQWERDLTAPETECLPQIADLLHISLDDLFGIGT